MPIRRRAALLALAPLLLVAACGDDDGAADGPAIDGPLPAAADLPAPDATLCLAVGDLVDAQAAVDALLAEGRAAGTTEQVVTSEAYRAATGDLAAASAVYLSVAPAEVSALAQEKERLDDAVGAQLLADGEVGDDGRAWLARAKAIDEVLEAYAVRHCDEAAAPS